MDPFELFEKNLAGIQARIMQAIQEAYEKGYERGGAEMRDRILKAASTPAGTVTITEPIMPPEPEVGGQARAPRGRVGELIDSVLTQYGARGLKGVRIENHVVQIDDRVARKSVGNELRRFKSKRYRQDNQKRWFLIPRNGEKETAGNLTKDRPAVSALSNHGGSHAATLV